MKCLFCDNLIKNEFNFCSYSCEDHFFGSDNNFPRMCIGRDNNLIFLRDKNDTQENRLNIQLTDEQIKQTKEFIINGVKNNGR